MNAASARVILGDRPVGTAWRFHERCALTAAHCLGDEHDLRQLPETVYVQFPGVKPLKARTRVERGLDAALLEFVENVPTGIPMIKLAKLPPGPISRIQWSGIAYPLVSDFRPLLLRGELDRDEDEDDELQISFNIENRRVAGNKTLLSYASGAAVTYNGRAVGIVRESLVETKLGYAVPIDRIASAFPEVREQLSDNYPFAPGGATWRELDRKQQWYEVEAAIARRESKVLLLPGARREKHQYFVERVRSFLAGSPGGELYEVPWPSDDAWTLRDLVAATSNVLLPRNAPPSDGDERQLVQQLRLAIGRGLPVIVHALLDPERHAGNFDTVVAYYREVLPRVLAEAALGEGQGILWLQPIEWSHAVGRSRGIKAVIDKLTSRLPCRRQVLPQDRAMALITKLKRKVPSPCVDELEKLKPVVREHLEELKAPPDLVELWEQNPTTEEAFRLLRNSTTGGSHGR